MFSGSLSERHSPPWRLIQMPVCLKHSKHCQTKPSTNTNATTVATAITNATVCATAFFVEMSHIVFLMDYLKHLPTAAMKIWSGWILVDITFNFFSQKKFNIKYLIPFTSFTHCFFSSFLGQIVILHP